MQLAVDRLVDARWTDAIHREWMRSLAARMPDIPIERLQATRQLMNAALPTAMVSVSQQQLRLVNLPDPDDRHVVAAGIAAGASLILTWNLRDFPAAELRKHGLRRQNPDIFLAELYDDAPDPVIGSLANARRNLSKSRVSASDFIGILRNQRLGRLADRIRNHVSDL